MLKNNLVKKKKAHPERDIQFNFVDWIRTKHSNIPFWANVSEQYCHVAWRNIMYRMGFLKGVCDLFFPRGNTSFKGLVIELKAKTGKASKEQLNFMSMMTQEGYACFIAYSLDEAKLIFCTFYGIEFIPTPSENLAN